jgi:hypothetical protein
MRTAATERRKTWFAEREGIWIRLEKKWILDMRARFDRLGEGAEEGPKRTVRRSRAPQ